MGDKRYVQHISRQGEKWEVFDEQPRHWRATFDGLNMTLPKSEYVLCEPPETWVDVTSECVSYPWNWPEKENDDTTFYLVKDRELVREKSGYRLRKVKVEWFNGVTLGEAKPGWAFIVERKEPS